MKIINALIASLLLSACPVAAANASLDRKLVDPAATQAAIDLYDYLLANYGQNVLTGAVASGVKDTKMAEYIKGVTGHYPLINCFDFMEHYQCAPVNSAGWSRADYSNPEVEYRWMSDGGIVSYQWHWFVPVSYDVRNDFSRYEFYCNTSDGHSTTFSAANAMKEGSWERQIIDRDIDAVASYLLKMQQRGIPVLWRPLHEACGNYGKYSGGKAWFWWGNSGPEAYKKLWRYMFARLRDKGVHNLIWVWTSCGGDADWYPGDDVVDIIGRDYYESAQNKFHKSLSSEYRYLQGVSTTKMLALTECGAIPSFAEMSAHGDLWSWAVPWNGDYTTGSYHNTPEFFRTEYASEGVIHRDNRLDTPSQPVPDDFSVVTLYKGSPLLMTWSDVNMYVDAEQAASISVGDKLRVTVSEIGNSADKYPKVLVRCFSGWDAICQWDIWDDRGKSMPRQYTVTVTSAMLPELHKGFFLGGEDCRVSRFELLTRRSVISEVELSPEENCGVNGSDVVADLYSLQGVLLYRNVSLGDVLDRLPAGIYIHAGRKIAVR